MATEAPLIKDGGQMVAAANYWNPASALSGPNGSGQFLLMALTGTVTRTVTLATGKTQVIYGVLQNTPALGQAADVGIFGVSKVVAGAAIANIGTPLMWGTGGTVITYTSAGYIVGYNLEPSAGANQVITAFIFPGQLGGLA